MYQKKKINVNKLKLIFFLELIAITSGRGDANCEIGMAAMDLQYPHLIISQISDTQTFTNTLANINLFHPIEVPKK